MNNISNKREDIFQKATKLPDFVQEAMSNSENAKINAEIRDKYKLDEDQFSALLYLLVRVYVKDIYLQNFPKVLKEELKIKDDALVKKIALEIAQRRFFPLKEYLIGIENLIKNLGGEIPKIISKPKSKISSVSKPKKIFKDISQSKSESKIVQKDIKSAIREYDELENQIITSFPIKIIGISETIKPSIKNWLNDYIQSVGVGQHSNIERLDYLYHSSNAIKLKESERKLLAEILKSYDEEIMLPIRNGRVDLKFLKEKLLKERLKR